MENINSIVKCPICFAENTFLEKVLEKREKVTL